MSVDGLAASKERALRVAADRGRVAPGHAKSRRVVEELLKATGLRIDGPQPWDIQVHDARFYDRVLTGGSLGLGESYVEGWWDCARIDETICKIVEADVERHVGRPLRVGLAALRAHVLNLQNPKRAAEVCKVHYDLEVELFQRMLGPTMVYSCAYWKDATDLDGAQEDKLDLICRKLGIRGDDSVLDIGCGWGGFLRHVTQRFGCRATGTTISAGQCAYARDFCRELPVRVLLSDYRAPRLGREGPFDKVACMGMFEHVGRKNYRAFMKVVHGLLAEEGLFLLQTVGRGGSTGATEPWVEKYIFPNGMLPSAAEVSKAIEGLFVMEDWHNFGADYDRTLMAWHSNFEAFAEVGEAALGRRFWRMWRYYLLSFAGNFRARRGPQLWQIVLSKKGVKGGYRSVR